MKVFSLKRVFDSCSDKRPRRAKAAPQTEMGGFYRRCCHTRAVWGNSRG